MLYMRRSLRSAFELSSPQDIFMPLLYEVIAFSDIVGGVCLDVNKIPFI